MTVRFEIRAQDERFLIFDNQAQAFARARFHTRQQAEDWVLAQVIKFVPQSSSAARGRAHLITDNVLAAIRRNGQPDAGYAPA